MTWIIRIAKSAIGVVDPKPYLEDWIDMTPYWGAKQSDAERFPCRCSAFGMARMWGPSWRDAVRVVRLVRRRK